MAEKVAGKRYWTKKQLEAKRKRRRELAALVHPELMKELGA